MNTQDPIDTPIAEIFSRPSKIAYSGSPSLPPLQPVDLAQQLTGAGSDNQVDVSLHEPVLAVSQTDRPLVLNACPRDTRAADAAQAAGGSQAERRYRPLAGSGQ